MPKAEGKAVRASPEKIDTLEDFQVYQEINKSRQRELTAFCICWSARADQQKKEIDTATSALI